MITKSFGLPLVFFSVGIFDVDIPGDSTDRDIVLLYSIVTGAAVYCNEAFLDLNNAVLFVA